ncbi:MAG: SDR family oxidoreductase [Chthonomonadales bacterium]|nr:SDR family oxidoreductase [Chthonomonadales bacterium]
MFRLDGQATLVTGGASGIGAAICRAFAAQGARVVVADIDEAGARRLAESLGASAIAARADVTSPADVEAALAAAVERFGRLDVLVNNAGIGFVGGADETPLSDFERLMQVNVHGVWHGCRAAVPIMLEQGSGCIINIGSVAGLVGVERRFAYCATKGAVMAMTRQLAVDYATRGIRANCVAPGTIHTPFVDAYLHRFHAGEEEAMTAALHARQPIGRMGTPDDVAGMAVYLASSEAAFVTGAVLAIDGGWTAR